MGKLCSPRPRAALTHQNLTTHPRPIRRWPGGSTAAREPLTPSLRPIRTCVRLYEAARECWVFRKQPQPGRRHAMLERGYPSIGAVSAARNS